MYTKTPFSEYDAANPEIYRLFKKFSVMAYNAGFRHYSARGIFHRLRWHAYIDKSVDQDGFKINNNYSKDYAQKLMNEDPRFVGFFRMRNSQGLDE